MVSPLGYSNDFPWVERGTQSVSSSIKPIKLAGKIALSLPDLEGCSVEIVKTVLLSAESDKATIVGTNTEPPDLSNELRAIQARRDVEAAEQAKEAAEQAKKEVADEARQKRLAAEQKKKDAELNARIAKERAQEEARAAEERRKVRAACAVIYLSTADKKLKDLTVREEQQVRACQALGLYPPQQ